MSQEIKLNKRVYNKDIYLKTIDTSFSQLGQRTIQEVIDSEPTIEEFFELYNQLFFDIPENGDNNSHESLIKRSSEYINFSSDSSEIQALQDEISQLRQELLNTQTQLIEALNTN